MADQNSNPQGGMFQGTPVDNAGVPGGGEGNGVASNESNPFADIFDEETGQTTAAPVQQNNNTQAPVVNPPTVTIPPVDPNAVVVPPVPVTPTVETPAETPEQIQARNDAWNKEYDKQLAQVYAIPDDVKVHFTPEQADVYQRGMMHTHKMVKMELLNLIQQAIPHVFKQQFEQHQQGTQVVSAFKAEYPKIDEKNPQHNQILRTVAAVINQMNPNFTPEQRRKAIGTMVYAQLGLTNDAPVVNNTQSSPPAQRQYPNAKSMGGGNVSIPANPNSQDENPFANLTNQMVESGY